MNAEEEFIAEAIKGTLLTPNESDRCGEAANVVDGLFAIARAINRIADALYNMDAQDGPDMWGN